MRCSVMVALTSGMSNTCRTNTFTAAAAHHRNPHRQRAHDRPPCQGNRCGATRTPAHPAAYPACVAPRATGCAPADHPTAPRGVRRVPPQPALKLHDPRLQLLDHNVPPGQQPKELLNGGRRVKHRASRPATNPRIKPTRGSTSTTSHIRGSMDTGTQPRYLFSEPTRRGIANADKRCQSLRLQSRDVLRWLPGPSRFDSNARRK